MTIAGGFTLKKINDVTADDVTSSDVIGAGTPATNDWLNSHDDKCQILANWPPSHLDLPKYPPHPHHEKQLADGVAVVAARPCPVGFLIVHSSLPLKKRHGCKLS